MNAVAFEKKKSAAEYCRVGEGTAQPLGYKGPPTLSRLLGRGGRSYPKSSGLSPWETGFECPPTLRQIFLTLSGLWILGDAMVIKEWG